MAIPSMEFEYTPWNSSMPIDHIIGESATQGFDR